MYKNYVAHDPKERAVVGDLVAIEYCDNVKGRILPFRLTHILKESRRYQHPITGTIFTTKGAFIPSGFLD